MFLLVLAEIETNKIGNVKVFRCLCDRSRPTTPASMSSHSANNKSVHTRSVTLVHLGIPTQFGELRSPATTKSPKAVEMRETPTMPCSNPPRGSATAQGTPAEFQIPTDTRCVNPNTSRAPSISNWDNDGAALLPWRRWPSQSSHKVP